MRIEAYTQVQQLYKTNKAAKTAKAESVSQKDAVEISSIGKDYQIAKKAVSETADIRESKLASLKADIQAGTYHVSGNSFAEKVIAKYDEQAGLL